MALDRVIREMAQMRSAAGDIGIEIEVEGRNLPMMNNAVWTTHEDNSLRGPSAEYVLTKPISEDACEEALDLFTKDFKAAGAVAEVSPRTSVHIHRNCQKLFIQEIYTVAACYFLVEPLMVYYAGPARVGNQYCLSAGDAEYLPMRLAQGLKSEEYLYSVRGDDVRYSSINFSSLFKFGSLEFRAMRGTVDKEEILDWIAVINKLFKWAGTFKNPKEVWNAYLDKGHEAIIKENFPKPFVNFVFNLPNWKDLMNNGSLYTFEIAHAIPEWMVIDPAAKRIERKLAAKKPKPTIDERITYWRISGYTMNQAEILAHWEDMNARLLDVNNPREAIAIAQVLIEQGHQIFPNRVQAPVMINWAIGQPEPQPVPRQPRRRQPARANMVEFDEGPLPEPRPILDDEQDVF